LGASTSPEPYGLSRPVTGIAFFLFRDRKAEKGDTEDTQRGDRISIHLFKIREGGHKEGEGRKVENEEWENEDEKDGEEGYKEGVKRRIVQINGFPLIMLVLCNSG
jgi:hypothetical protein